MLQSILQYDEWLLTCSTSHVSHVAVLKYQTDIQLPSANLFILELIHMCIANNYCSWFNIKVTG